MRRRAFLASAAAGLAALTGCLGGGSADADAPAESPTGSGGTPTETPATDAETPTTDTGTPTTATPSDATVSFGEFALQYGIVMPSSPDSIGVEHVEAPYVVASVSVDGDLARDDFGLAVGDERVAPSTPGQLYRTAWGEEQWYDRDRGEGLLLFDLSGVAAGDVRVTWPGGERPFDGEAAERLERGPPDLSASLDVPETHDGSEAPPVGIEVTNEGDVAARFVGALNRVGPLVAYTPVTRVSELVGAGDSARIEVADDWGGAAGERGTPGDGEPDVKYYLYYAGGEDSAEIKLQKSD